MASALDSAVYSGGTTNLARCLPLQQINEPIERLQPVLAVGASSTLTNISISVVNVYAVKRSAGSTTWSLSSQPPAKRSA